MARLLLLGAAALLGLGLVLAWSGGSSAPVDPYQMEITRAKAAATLTAIARQTTEDAANAARWQLVAAAMLPIGGTLAVTALAGLLVMSGVAVWERRRPLVQVAALGVPVDRRALHAGAYQTLPYAVLEQRTQAAIAAGPQVPHSLTLHNAYRNDVQGVLPADGPALDLPGVTTLGQVLTTGWRPSQQSILLGLGPGATRLTVPTGDMLCHVALSGTTGAGKTNLLRLLLTQLEAAGCGVYLLDPHYADIDPKTGDDWRAIAAATVPGRAIWEPREISAVLREAEAELTRRLTARREGQGSEPRFYAIEEAPMLAGADKDLMEHLARLLKEGRKVDLFLILTAQDFLVKTLGGSSGDLAQFSTGYYGGGDPVTGRRVLKSRTDLPEPPGRGVVYLRSAVTQPAQLVRVPLVDNADIARLLATPVATPVATQGTALATYQATAPPATAQATTPDVSLEARTALTLFRQHKSMARVVETMYGITSDKGRLYQAKLTEVSALVADAIDALDT